MRSSVLAFLLTLALASAVGASAVKALLLYEGLMIGMHAFLGNCRYYRHLSAVFRMQ